MMMKMVLIIGMLVILSDLCLAQDVPPFFAITTKDKVYIILGKIPDGAEGFHLYRKGPKDKDFILLTPEPVRPVRDPILFRSMIGEDYEWLKKATRGETEFQVLRRILRDRGLQVAFSFASLRVAQALGRLYVDEEVGFIKERYVYKVVFLNILDKEIASHEREVVVEEAMVPKPPFEAKVTPGDTEIRVEWKYHKLLEYTVVGFNIYRKAEGEKEFTKINDVLILWQEKMTYRVDYEVENGKRYTYYVTAVDLIGMESKPSNLAEAVPVDLTPPGMPEGVVVVPKEDKVIIAWRMNLELDLSHYNLYRGMGLRDTFKKINKEPIPGDFPYYEDEKITPGKPYFYKVQAVDKSGNESRLTSAISGLVEDKTPPPPPTNLTAKVEKRKVTLDWQQKKGEDLLGFYVYRGENEEDFMRIVKLPVEGEAFTDKGYQEKGLVPGMTYSYGVSAVDTSYNESGRVWTRVKIPDDEPPATPVSIYANPTEDGKVEVRWQVAHSRDVAGYRVYRGVDERPEVVGDFEKSTLYFLDEDVERGKRYFYQVVAVDHAGNESKPTDRFYVAVRDVSIPPTPKNIKAVFEKKEVLISWDEVKIDDLAGYRVYCADIPSGVYELLNPDEPVKKAGFVHKKGREGLFYKVTAVDTSLNESEASAPVRARTR